jgi:hypothetical protein
MADKNENKTDITVFGYIFVQVTILVLHYGGFVKGLPNWVVWFPTIVQLVTLIVVGIIALVAIIISAGK